MNHTWKPTTNSPPSFIWDPKVGDILDVKSGNYVYGGKEYNTTYNGTGGNNNNDHKSDFDKQVLTAVKNPSQSFKSGFQKVGSFIATIFTSDTLTSTKTSKASKTETKTVNGITFTTTLELERKTVQTARFMDSRPLYDYSK